MVTLSLPDLVRYYDKTQWMNSVALQELRKDQLAKCTLHHKQHNTWFGNWEGTTLKRRDLQLAGSNFITDRITPHFSVTSSGSTGESVTITRSANCNTHWAAHTHRLHAWHGPTTLRLSSIRPIFAKEGVRDSWGFPLAALGSTGPAQYIPSYYPLDRQVQLLATFAPHVLLVFPSVLHGLLDAWEDQPGMLPATLQRIHTVSETVDQDLRQRVASAGLTLVDCYTLSEAGYIAIQCPVSGLYHVMEPTIVELLRDDDTPCQVGESGRVVVSDTTNYSSPVIRYETGDYAIRGPCCVCGRGLETFERILGRRRNLITLPDGSRRWPVVGHRTFRDIADIQQVQVIQHSVDDIEAIVVADMLSEEQHDKLRQKIQISLQYPLAVRITHRPQRLPSLNGKFEEFISHVGSDQIRLVK
jgi:phenylacetate-CoA ligase